MASNLASALTAIPSHLRDPLLTLFEEALTEYRMQRWEAVGLKVGKLCETSYCILEGHLTGTFPTRVSKPKNMLDACRGLEKYPATFSRAARIQMPRVIAALYELRNNRAIGHIGGEVSPNHMDAEMFLRGAKWIIAELIRIFDAVDPDGARELVEQVTERTIPIVWQSGGVRRVLDNKMSAKDKALVLLYGQKRPTPASELAKWAEYSNTSRFKNDVLKGLHKAALVHYDVSAQSVEITPLGASLVEERQLLASK